MDMEEFRGEKRATKKLPIFVIFGLVLFFVFLNSPLGWGRGGLEIAQAASAPMIITYQGKLLVGSYLATTTQSIYFILYDSLSGGSALYSASGTAASPNFVSVVPSQGLFSINFGDTGTNPITSTIFRDNASVFLEVRIGADTLTPRKRITSVPYAFNSRFLDGVPGDTLSTTTYIPISDSLGNFRFNSTTITTATIGVATIGTSTIGRLVVTSSQRIDFDLFNDVFSLPNYFSPKLLVGKNVTEASPSSISTIIGTINVSTTPQDSTAFTGVYGFANVPSTNAANMLGAPLGSNIIGVQGEAYYAGTGNIRKTLGLSGMASQAGSGTVNKLIGVGFPPGPGTQ